MHINKIIRLTTPGMVLLWLSQKFIKDCAVKIVEQNPALSKENNTALKFS
jgi:hypothetical protein